jgi:hypothetical protein
LAKSRAPIPRAKSADKFIGKTEAHPSFAKSQNPKRALPAAGLLVGFGFDF